MKKRSLRILLVCCMALLLLSVTALAADIDLDQDYVTQNQTEGPVYGSGGGVPLRSGNTYKLTGNLELDGKFLYVASSSETADHSVTLDLNGHTLTIKDPVSLANENFGVKYYYDRQGRTARETSPIGFLVYTTFDADADRTTLTLTLKDSSDAKTGTLDVQGASATGIYVGRNCTLNIEGGTITDSYQRSEAESLSSAGVQTVLGTVNLTGGSIKNQAGGVVLRGGTFTMSGSAMIENCGYQDEDNKPQGYGGVYAYIGYKERTDTTGISNSNAHPSALTMSGGTIQGCMGAAGGGISLLNGSTFTMTNGTITGCKASGQGAVFSGFCGGGGVLVNGTFTMSGGTISNCQAVGDASGGGVYVGGVFNMSGNAKITGCKAAAGGGVRACKENSGDTTAFTMSGSASITNCEAPSDHGGGGVEIYCSEFTMEDSASITGCTAGDGGNGGCLLVTRSDAAFSIADSVTIDGQITQCFFNWDGRIDGLGSVKYPYQIGSKEELVLFRTIVNNGFTTGQGTIPAQPAACAELTDDIDLSGENWTPIGQNTGTLDETLGYSGTFNGNGHTISGLSVTGDFQYAGLFGVVKGGAIKNLTVSGSVAGSSTENNIAAGGIAGKVTSSTIEACANLCGVSANQYVGGIVGMIHNTTVRDCYNSGEISGGSNTGGIGGMTSTVSQNNTIANCYNVGSVSASVYAGGILGNAGLVNVSNCYYLKDLKGTAQKAIGFGDVDYFADKTAAEFANGTVLALLKAGERTGTDPWAAECKYLAAVGRTLPVFRGQGNAHSHDSDSEWESNDAQHWKVCSCGAVFQKDDHTGGTASCTEKAKCKDCGSAYGELGAHRFTAEVVDAKYLKSAATCTEKAVYYKSCAVCGEKGTETFEYGEKEPNNHTGTLGEWQQNDADHWKVYSCCRAEAERTAHHGGTATCTEKAVCAACGQPYGETNPGNHTGTEQWTATAAGHQKKWSCCGNAATQEEAHHWENGVCRDCGYVCLHGDLTHVSANPATTRAPGNIEHWHCAGCSKYFADAKAQQEITQAETVIPQLPALVVGPSAPVVDLAEPENGSISVDPKHPAKGSTVTVTVEPDEGYALDEITVADKDGNALKLTDKGDGKYEFTMPSGKVDIDATFKKLTETSPFADVSTDAYYYEAVKWAAENSITGGVGNGLFGPDGTCSRAQIVTFLWRAAGSPEPKALSAFTDVASDAYYAKAVAWAVKNGITNGTSATTFSPDDPCTRGQAVTFLWRALGQLTGDKASFSDVPADSYFAQAVAWAAANGVTTGVGNNLFAPGGDCTRAQIVTFLWRCAK